MWRFQSIDFDGPFACTNIAAEKLQFVIKKMGQLETMTWHDIDGKTGSHPIRIGDVCKDARDRLLAIGSDERSPSVLMVTSRQ